MLMTLHESETLKLLRYSVITDPRHGFDDNIDIIGIANLGGGWIGNQ